MRFGLTIASAMMLSGSACFAGTINDTFGQSQYACVLTYSAPYDTCDVVGNEALYDIQKASVSFGNGVATVSIYTNTGAVGFGGPLTLGSFNDAGETLIPGDIFFYDPNSAQDLQYGIALTDHGSFTAGDLYNISGDIDTETAQMALQDSSDYYRWDETVLMAGTGAPASSGSVTVTNYGDGIHKAEYEITVTVPLTSGLLSLLSNGQIGLQFSSADCGNDVIQGVVSTGYTGSLTVSPAAVAPVPEPGPGILMLTGLALLAIGRQWGRQWRKRTKSGN